MASKVHSHMWCHTASMRICATNTEFTDAKMHPYQIQVRKYQVPVGLLSLTVFKMAIAQARTCIRQAFSRPVKPRAFAGHCP